MYFEGTAAAQKNTVEDPNSKISYE